MRMWMVNPTCMCRKHLLGEHVELHMLFSSMKRGISLKGYLEKGLVNPEGIYNRHEELKQEMLNRGYNHKSEMVNDEDLFSGYGKNEINETLSWEVLSSRCPECKKRKEELC